MCSKELAALAAVLLLALGTLTTMVSLAGYLHYFTSKQLPAKSALANFTWQPPNASGTVTDSAVDHYYEHGYTVLRGVLDPKGLAILLQEVERLCKIQFRLSMVCQIEEGRWQSDVIRDFLFYSPLGNIASMLLRDQRSPALRVYQDGVIGVTKNWFKPIFFSFTKHIDHGGSPGIWHGLHSDTTGVGVWIPLVSIDPNVTGGGVELYDKFPLTGCQVVWGERSTIHGFDEALNRTKIDGSCRAYKADNDTVIPAVDPGDVVAWLPSMMHRTQPVKQKGFTRYALYARIVTNETILCMHKDCGWKGRPCCSGWMPKSGAYLRTPCFPQVFPNPVREEVRAHFGKKPEPLIDRHRMESKYNKDTSKNMHDRCRGHRPGGAKPFWKPLFYEKPAADDSLMPTLTPEEFSCENTDEGDCWFLNLSGLQVGSVPWILQNFSRNGLPFFFSMDYEDIEHMYRIPDGGNVRGTAVDDNWLSVGDYYVMRDFYGAKMVRADEAARAPLAAAGNTTNETSSPAAQLAEELPPAAAAEEAAAPAEEGSAAHGAAEEL